MSGGLIVGGVFVLGVMGFAFVCGYLLWQNWREGDFDSGQVVFVLFVTLVAFVMLKMWFDAYRTSIFMARETAPYISF